MIGPPLSRSPSWSVWPLLRLETVWGWEISYWYPRLGLWTGVIGLLVCCPNPEMGQGVKFQYTWSSWQAELWQVSSFVRQFGNIDIRLVLSVTDDLCLVTCLRTDDTDLSYPQPRPGDQWLGHVRNIHLVTMSKVLQTRILHLQEYLHRSNLHHLLPAPLELSQLGHPHRQSCWPSNRNKTVRKNEPKRGAISRATLTTHPR